jgi:RNA polymerase-binding transcription factor DksA
MNTVRQVLTTDAISPMLGYTWALLDAERHDIRASLFAASPKATRTVADEAHQSGWNRIEVLQTRLGQVDRAMDRLMAGRYGLCAECGGTIEQKRLAADPAASVCYSCQTGIETQHTLRSL